LLRRERAVSAGGGGRRGGERCLEERAAVHGWLTIHR
jgi:hypothetical protein